MKNIILIGMPGAGKSSIGVVLAKVLGYKFIDSDLVIQDKTQKLLKDIIESEGIDRFIEIENNINSQIFTNRSIIATGGSVIYGREAMEHFSKIGTIVYLKLSLDTIKERLGDIEKRGVVIKKDQTLENLYNERCPIYEKYSHLTIDAENKQIREVVSEIKLIYERVCKI